MKMINLEMRGPFPLNSEEVRRQVLPNRIGNYAFGTINDEGIFLILYIGRSDTDLQTEIIARAAAYKQCTHFMFSYANSTKEAFEKECKNFHECGGADGLLNQIHPDKPNGTDYECPYCE